MGIGTLVLSFFFSITGFWGSLNIVYAPVEPAAFGPPTPSIDPPRNYTPWRSDSLDASVGGKKIIAPPRDLEDPKNYEPIPVDGAGSKADTEKAMSSAGYQPRANDSLCPASTEKTQIWEKYIGGTHQCVTLVFDDDKKYRNAIYSEPNEASTKTINECIENNKKVEIQDGVYKCGGAAGTLGGGGMAAGGGGGAQPDSIDTMKNECETAYQEAERYCQSPISGAKIINTPMLLQMAGMFAPLISGMAGNSAQDAGRSIANQCENAKTLGIALGGLNAAYAGLCTYKRDDCKTACQRYREVQLRGARVPTLNPAILNNPARLADYYAAQERQDTVRYGPDYQKANEYYNTCSQTYGMYVAQAGQQLTQYGMQAAAAANCQNVASNPCFDTTKAASLPQCQATCENPSLKGTPTCLCQADPSRPDCPKLGSGIADYKPYCQTPEGLATKYCKCQTDPSQPDCLPVGGIASNGGALNTGLSGVPNSGSLSNDVAALTSPDDIIPEEGKLASAAAVLEAKARGGGIGGNGQFGLQGGNGRGALGKSGAASNGEMDRGFRTQGGGGNTFTVPYATQGGKGLASAGGERDSKLPFDLRKFLPSRDSFRSPASIVGPDGITAANGLSIWEKASRQYRIEAAGQLKQ